MLLQNITEHCIVSYTEHSMLQYDVIYYDEVEYVIINTTSYNLGLEFWTLNLSKQVEPETPSR